MVKIPFIEAYVSGVTNHSRKAIYERHDFESAVSSTFISVIEGEKATIYDFDYSKKTAVFLASLDKKEVESYMGEKVQERDHEYIEMKAQQEREEFFYDDSGVNEISVSALELNEFDGIASEIDDILTNEVTKLRETPERGEDIEEFLNTYTKYERQSFANGKIDELISLSSNAGLTTLESALTEYKFHYGLNTPVQEINTPDGVAPMPPDDFEFGDR